ncbi:unnamed protein product [Mortierella alpina]
MEETQSFRLVETKDTAEITLHHMGGQNVVSWEDIEQVFPGAKRVLDGKSVMKFLRGSNQQSNHCCAYSVLDVILSSSVELVGAVPSNLDPIARRTDLTGALVDATIEDKTVTALDVAPHTLETTVGNIDTSSSPKSDASSKAALFHQVVTRASRKARESEIEQRFISLLAPKVQETVRASSEIYQAFGRALKHGDGEFSRAELRQEMNFQELKTMMAKNMSLNEDIKKLQVQALDNDREMRRLQEQALDNDKEMKRLQEKALERLAVIQSRVQAVLTQTYELHEYPIPRLFVVLPQDPSGWDATNPFSNKFRLYFLCECGEHTKSIDSKTEIHFAKHEGYEIARPTEFFQLYGSHVLTILKMLKFGISVAGVAVPAISHLVRADVVDQVEAYLKVLKDIEPRMDRVIDWMDKISVNEGEAVDEFARQMENKEALAGADLRKLNTFLGAKDGDNALGNLYRTVTDEGHVKWVCIDHFRENYQESTAEDFQRMLDSVAGSFDKSKGRVEVKLRSRVLAEQFFTAFGKARSVYDLDVAFEWACTTSDLELLERGLQLSRVATVAVRGIDTVTGSYE